MNHSEEEKNFVITIDGPAGAGKSTIARLVAKKLKLPYLDTGAIYRSIAWLLNEKQILPTEDKKISAILKDFSISFDGSKVLIDGRDISKEIRTPEIDKLVSPYSAIKGVRDALLQLQRDQSAKGLVAEGRDMGTVVFPDAALKIFLTASAEERALRRYKERIEKCETANYDEILKQVNDRDNYDMNREIAPLRPAVGCVVINTTKMTIDEVVETISSFAALAAEHRMSQKIE